MTKRTPARYTGSTYEARVASGRKQIQVWLSPEAQENLAFLMKHWSATYAKEVIEKALARAAKNAGGR